MNETSDKNTGSGFNSSETISWKALREAEKLDNIDFVPQLIDFINQEKNKNNRDRAYFILGHLTKNTSSPSATQFLINRLTKESDKYVISSLLDRIADLNKPTGTDLIPIIDATKSDKWLIRHSAIHALKNSDDKIAEHTLIEILEKSEDPNDWINSNSSLNNMGTSTAIPYIEKHLTSRKRDVKMSAKLAIEEITKREAIN